MAARPSSPCSRNLNGQTPGGPRWPRPSSAPPPDFLALEFSKPARKIFHGLDGGAMFLGFLMANAGPQAPPVTTLPRSPPWLAPALILGATIFLTPTLVTISRASPAACFRSPRLEKDHSAQSLG